MSLVTLQRGVEEITQRLPKLIEPAAPPEIHPPGLFHESGKKGGLEKAGTEADSGSPQEKSAGLPTTDPDKLRQLFARITNQAEDVLAQLASELDRSPEAYLGRLSRLASAYGRATGERWLVEVVHLQVIEGSTRPGLTFHGVGAPAGALKSPLPCTCRDLLQGTILFQLALRLAEPGSTLSLLTLPPGPFALSNFPRAYGVLIVGEPGSGQIVLTQVKAPAVVQQGGEILGRLAGEFRR